MIRRLAALIAALALLVSLAPAAMADTTTGVGPRPLSPHNCGGVGSPNLRHYVGRYYYQTDSQRADYDSGRANGQYTRVYGQARLEDIKPCIGSAGVSSVFPANLDFLDDAAPHGVTG